MSSEHRGPFDPDVTEDEMQRLDVDLQRVWHGVTGEIWSTPASRTERLAGSLLRSPALARALVNTPSLIVSWIIASAVVFVLGALVANATDTAIVPLLAPAVAALAVAFAYGAGADPTYEIARTMPTPARMILLVRVSVVFATNALLGMAASFLAPSLSGITMLWLLPMVAISLLGLAVAVITHSATIGAGAALVAWSTVVLATRYTTNDLSAAVSESSLEALAPLYLAVAICSMAVTLWMSGDGSKRRELAGWL